MVRRILDVLAVLAVVLAIGACADKKSHTRAVYMLIDTSGTYTQELGRAQALTGYILGTLNPGDSFAVARVKSRSFSEKDILAKVTFEKDPIQANAQKRAFPINLKGISIVALNVTKLTTDNIDPRRYLNRMEWWEKRVRAAGAADWRMVNDLEHPERIFGARRETVPPPTQCRRES